MVSQSVDSALRERSSYYPGKINCIMAGGELIAESFEENVLLACCYGNVASILVI